ncbi:hypothetical protein TVAG_457190 [Trichomonas vaginalis G3]|uniref:E3 ubiquitin ligase UBR4 C-terminal domain-containing protein n=1 Tax=Trichomonas vaginalis (strain ATCC PRA-98 / G3) TaxID=412133 RepID=A2DC43_TRIV3|nr:E3 ubiquitin-protein ligase ubr4 family [Trichomonas vaginalis G3]EAY22084.1 hypothetical protein TVAG_457190 [Trichomonas vaginalis G3]KAI5525273.1 E3 ubiquitin-protein ligase ubr4 family [Trichomonas vaginalis G3]|eukprot:XP_001583070.1 hypothetical protein [Trichomonas vaginalis G3]
MERFLALTHDPSSGTPPIEVIINEINENKNVVFYTMGNWLNSAKGINPTYTYVSIRDIVDLSPLNLERSKDPEQLNPLQSFKWLYLIYSLVSRKVSDDEELEEAKMKYIFTSIFDFIKSVDLKINFAAEFTSAVIVLAARLLQNNNVKIAEIINDQVYQQLLAIFNSQIEISTKIKLNSFPNQNLLLFLSPLPIEFYEKHNIFKNISLILKSAVVRLLLRTVKHAFPQICLDDMKISIQTLCYDSPILDQATQLLIHLFKDNSIEAYKYKDQIRYQTLSNKLISHSDTTNCFKKPINYKIALELSQDLLEIEKIAQEHPEVWEDFLSENTKLQNALEDILMSDYDDQFIVAVVSLLCLGHAKVKNIELVSKLFFTTGIQSVRKQMKDLLLIQPDVSASIIAKHFKDASNHGSQSEIFFSLVTELIKLISDPKDLINSLLVSLRTEYDLLKLHPNIYIYSELQKFIDISSSYLDEQPCAVCNNPERLPTLRNSKDIVDGYKYTHEDVLMKLKHPLIISSFILSYNIKKPEKFPQTVKIFVCLEKILDNNQLLEIKEWRFISEMKLNKNERASKLDLTLPVTATCVKFHFCDIKEEQTHIIYCPACHSEVDQRTGRCPNCPENAFHCRKCREIDVVHPNRLICTSCGNSNFLEYSIQMNCVKTFSHTRINSDEDMEQSLEMIDNLMSKVHNTLNTLQEYKGKIEFLLSPTNEISVNQRTSELKVIYNEKCKRSFQELTEFVQHVSAIRQSVSKYVGLTNSCNCECPENMCYNCKHMYITNGLSVIGKFAEISTTDVSDAMKFLISFCDVEQFSSSAISSLLSFCKLNENLTDKIIQLFLDSLPNPSPHLANLLFQILEIDDKFKLRRYKAVSNVLIETMKHVDKNPALVSIVVQPLSRALLKSNLLLRNRDDYLKFNILNTLSNMKLQTIDIFDNFSEDLIRSLLFSYNSQVRSDVSNLLFDISTISDKYFNKVFDFINQSFLNIQNLKKKENDQCLDLLSKLNEFSQKTHNHSINSKIIDNLIDKLLKETEQTYREENYLSMDLSVGYNIKLITNIIKPFITNDVDLLFICEKKSYLIEKLAKSYFILKSLILQRSKYLEDSSEIIKSAILKILSCKFMINEEEKFTKISEKSASLIVKSCAECLSQMKKSQKMIIKEMNELLFPKHKAKEFQIVLQKIRTQEIYIPGRISSNPFSNYTIGPKMVDVKKKICADLNMPDLMQDPHSMELLVNGNIISLDLNVEDVYINVWEPRSQNKPMLVIFRLQGLDGEAQEPMITSFRNNQGSEVTDDQIQKFGFSRILAKSDDLFVPFIDSIEISPTIACNVLTAFCQIQENEKKILEFNVIDKLLDSLKKLTEKSEKLNDKVAEKMIPVLGLANLLVNFDHSKLNDDDKIDSHIEFILKALQLDIVKNSVQLQSNLLSLLPHFACRRKSLMKTVMEFFIGGLRPKNSTEKFNFYTNCSNIYLLNSFSEFVNSLPNNDDENNLKGSIGHFLTDAINYVEENFDLNEGPKSKQWEKSVTKETLPAALKTLSGMAFSDILQQHLQKDDFKFLKLILQLRNVASTTDIGEIAEQIVKNLNLTPISEKLNSLIEEEKNLIKQKSNEEREKLLKQNEQMMSNNSQLQNLLSMLGDEEDQISCCICKDGFDFLLDEPLGIYGYFSKESNLATHFVFVHQKCHYSELKTPTQRMNEWQSASVRNVESPCNCIYPIPSPNEVISNYANKINKFYRSARNITSDINYHLEIVSQGKSINFKMGGGSLVNDIKVLPLLFYGYYSLIESSKRQIISKLNSTNSLTKQDAVDCLLLMTIEEWRHFREKILKDLLSNLVKDVPESERFGKIKSTVIYFLILNEANEMIKKETGRKPTENVFIEGNPDDKWINDFIERINNNFNEVLSEWQDLADKVQDEFLQIEDINTALIFANMEVENPNTWLTTL